MYIPNCYTALTYQRHCVSDTTAGPVRNSDRNHICACVIQCSSIYQIYMCVRLSIFLYMYLLYHHFSIKWMIKIPWSSTHTQESGVSCHPQTTQPISEPLLEQDEAPWQQRTPSSSWTSLSSSRPVNKFRLHLMRQASHFYPPVFSQLLSETHRSVRRQGWVVLSRFRACW